MSSFNKVILMGNLTRDPQMKYLPSQTPVVEFGIATNRRFKTASGEEREEVAFIDCSAFGKQAEVINQWCQKGKQLLIEGRLKYDTWEDRNGGGKRSKLSVVVENFQFVNGAREDRGGDQQTPGSIEPQADQRPARKRTATSSPLSEKPQFAEADIPF